MNLLNWLTGGERDERLLSRMGKILFVSNHRIWAIMSDASVNIYQRRLHAFKPTDREQWWADAFTFFIGYKKLIESCDFSVGEGNTGSTVLGGDFVVWTASEESLYTDKD